jgi:hypothetical protein
VCINYATLAIPQCIITGSEKLAMRGYLPLLNGFLDAANLLKYSMCGDISVLKFR